MHETFSDGLGDVLPEVLMLIWRLFTFTPKTNLWLPMDNPVTPYKRTLVATPD